MNQTASAFIARYAQMKTVLQRLSTVFAVSAVVLFYTSSVVVGQEQRFGPNDFVVGNEVFTVNSGSIDYGYIARGQGAGVGRETALPMSLRNSLSISKGDQLQFVGHKVMLDRDGVPQVYYRVLHRPTGADEFKLVSQPKVKTKIDSKGVARSEFVPESSQHLFIKAEDLIRAVGDDVHGCEILPRNAIRERFDANGELQRPRGRSYNTISQNFADIEAIKNGILKDLEIQVPALNVGFGEDDYHKNCLNFISGENELGPWGEFIVSEIIGTNRGERYHTDVDPKFFFDVPEGYFGDACPNFNNMSTGQKLGAWVQIIATLAMKESTCTEDKVNGDGSDSPAEGLLQANDHWLPEYIVLRNSKEIRLRDGRKPLEKDTLLQTILGRKHRGPGCDAKTSEQGRWLLDYEDALSCGIQILGDIVCGGYSKNFGKRPVCQPETRPESFFGASKISHQYFGPLKGTAAEDKKKRQRIEQELSRVPGCRG